MRATSEAVEGNKVRLSVEIDEQEVDKVLAEAVRTLSRQARVPGFRPGKVPRQILEARMGGAGALRAEALREAIPDFYAQALADTETDPISPPEIDITAGQDEGAVTFDAVVEVRPVVAIPGYAGLEVTVPSPLVGDEDVDAQIDRLRDTDAELVEVTRAVRDGDHVTIDLHGSLEGSNAGEELIASDDLLYEVGSGRVGPELDEQLRGAKVGDVLAFSAAAAGGSGGSGSGDTPSISFRVLVKEVKAKRLPEVTDEWAAEASEFSTVAELRDDLRTRLAAMKSIQAQMALRQGALRALAELVDDEQVPEALVEDELRQRVQDLGRRLEEQRLSVPQLLAATGRTEEALLEELRGESRQTVKQDLALRALADAESLEATDEEMDAEIDAMAARLQVAPPVVRERLTRAGRMAAVRSEQRKTKALDWLLGHVVVVDENGAPVSREDLRAGSGAGEEGRVAEEPEEDVEPAGDGGGEDAEQVVATSGTRARKGTKAKKMEAGA
jgi:trigger factor